MKVTLIRDDLESSKELEVELEDGSSVKDLLEIRDIPSEEVLASIEGSIVSKERVLEDGEEVRVFDVIAGG